jgi:hypothetical protein
VQIKRKGLLPYCWCDVVASSAPLICCARSGGGVEQISLWFWPGVAKENYNLLMGMVELLC